MPWHCCLLLSPSHRLQHELAKRFQQVHCCSTRLLLPYFCYLLSYLLQRLRVRSYTGYLLLEVISYRKRDVEEVVWGETDEVKESLSLRIGLGCALIACTSVVSLDQEGDLDNCVPFRLNFLLYHFVTFRSNCCLLFSFHYLLALLPGGLLFTFCTVQVLFRFPWKLMLFFRLPPFFFPGNGLSFCELCVTSVLYFPLSTLLLHACRYHILLNTYWKRIKIRIFYVIRSILYLILQFTV